MKSNVGITLIVILSIIFFIVIVINIYIFKTRNALYFNKRNWGKTKRPDIVGGDGGEGCE